MRIGIQTWGSRGDIVPLIALGQGLKDAGHTIHFFYSNALSDENFDHHSQPNLLVRSTKYFRDEENDIDKICVKPIFQMSLDDRSTYLMDELVKPYEPEIERATLDLCKNCELIITHPVIYQATTIAQKLGIPSVMLLVDYLFVPTRNNELFDATINRLHIERINNYRRKHSLPPVSNVRAQVSISSFLNLLIFSKIFQKDNIDLGHKFVLTGFLKSENNIVNKFPVSLSQFLEEGPAPFFFSMGNSGFYEDSTFGILDIFLEAIKLSGCRAIIQAPWSNLSRSIPNDPNIYQIGHIQHEQILPFCLAAVHHGGAGTTHTMLAMGCPSIVIAYIWDQFDWGKALARLGAAPGLLKRKTVDAIQLAGDIRKIMKDEEYKNSADAARMKVKRENGVRRAVKIIEEHMSKIRTTHEILDEQK